MYKVMVTQLFDTYPEWTRQFENDFPTMELAEEAETRARAKYYSRPLVSYSIRIVNVQEDVTNAK